MSNNFHIVVGVTGGIAAYKALDVVSSLRKKNIEVNVIMTSSALQFVTPLSFQSLSNYMVVSDMFAEPKEWEIQHISLSRRADAIIVIPATANIIGKVANGIADDMLSTTIMAAKCPVVFAPAMNTNMYENPILQQNISKLKSFGYRFILPQSGRLACGDIGVGKLADVDTILEYIMTVLYPCKDLTGKRVLVTAGPTIAPIDPVRYITNRSSGKMGFAVAREARDRGAHVVLVSGPTSLKPPLGIEFISVNTNEEMLNNVLDNFNNSDIVIKSAAVADFKSKIYSEKKIKKAQNEFELTLIKDTDILKKLGTIKKKQILVGFAAESNDLIQNASKKLSIKNLDYIVANDITSEDTGFRSDDNKVTILCNNGEKIELEKMGKREVAKKLFDIIVSKRNTL